MAPRSPLALLAGCAMLGGCVSGDQLSNVEYDPWESLNRGTYAVNDAADSVLLKPIARGYRAVMPTFARRGVSNFYDNLGTPRSALNNFLQGKPKRGFTDIGRFLFNSTLGIGGLFDVASASGVEEYDEDFGQTFAVWGVPDGPYVMLPFLGPRTLRDAVGLPFDFLADPLFHYDNSSEKDKLRGLQIIDLRTRLLAAEGFLEDSQDPYITLRESYLQNRNYEVHDGDPPVDDDFYDDFFDEDFEEEESSDNLPDDSSDETGN